MADSVHLPLSASFAPVWGRCSGAPSMVAKLSASIRELFTGDTEDARQGTAVHWYASQRLTGSPVADRAPNGVVLDDEMREAALVYVHDVRRAMHEASPGYICQVESGGVAQIIHPQAGGTGDAFLYDPVRRLLQLWELKYGHKEVPEFENLQLVVYLAVLLEKLRIDGHAEQGLTVEFRVVQPRCFTARGAIRSWRTSASALRPLYNMLRDQAIEATDPARARTVSGDHCYYCPARGNCEAAIRAGMGGVDAVGRAAPIELDPGALSFMLHTLRRAKKAIEAPLAAYEEQVEALIRAGTPVPGFGLEPTRGRLAWLPEMSAQAVAKLGHAYGIALTETKPVTPTQAKELGVPDDMVDAMSDRPSGVKLKAVDPDHIRRILSQ